MFVWHTEDPEVQFFELLAHIKELTNPDQIPKLFAKLLDGYGLKSVAYLGTGFTTQPLETPYLAVTYSPEWVEHYKTQRFVDIDPVVQIGLRRMLPIDWSEFDQEDKAVRRLFGEARGFGLGSHGISVPIQGRSGDRAVMSITSDVDNRDWRHLCLRYMRDFQLLGLHIHQAIGRIERPQHDERIALSPRERECLQWIAEGKTYWECATILGISEHTVRCYLESARHKLGASNNPHAVNKASRANLLSSLP